MVREFKASVDRPWGWWLRAHGGWIEDEDRRKWRSVVDALWHGQLEFPQSNFKAEQLEFLLRVLVAMDRRPIRPAEAHHDLFDGDMVFRRFYMSWLVSVGLADNDHGTPLDAGLTEFGRSVLLLLQLTREPEWIELPFTSLSARSFREELDGDICEATLAAFEREAARRRFVFAREGVHGGPSVTLTGSAEEARVPIRRVIWSQRFPDTRTRDDFFAWLAERVDRWDDWGSKAHKKGAHALTQHLFVLLAGREP